MATAPKNAAEGRSTLTQGSLVNIMPRYVIVKMMMAVSLNSSAAITQDCGTHAK
jgi:hypothetical protein